MELALIVLAAAVILGALILAFARPKASRAEPWPIPGWTRFWPSRVRSAVSSGARWRLRRP